MSALATTTFINKGAALACVGIDTSRHVRLQELRVFYEGKCLKCELDDTPHSISL